MAIRRMQGIGCVLAVLAVCNVVVVLSWMREPETPSSMQVSNQVSVEGGVPEQRRRIDEYLDDVDDEGIEELVENLNVHQDLLARIGARSNEPVPETQFEVCLANRRLAKLFEQLQKLDSADADATCRRIFSRKLETHTSTIDDGLQAWESGNPPRKPRPLFANCSALSAAVFLSAHFCPVDEVLRQLDEWHAYGASVEERVSRSPEKLSLVFTELKLYVYPQSLFEANVYAMMLKERCGVDLAGGSQASEVGTATFCAWNAHTNPYDFTHQSRYVPVDDSRVLLTFPYIQRWGPLAMFKEGHVQEMLQDLRRRVHRCKAASATGSSGADRIRHSG